MSVHVSSGLLYIGRLVDGENRARNGGSQIIESRSAKRANQRDQVFPARKSLSPLGMGQAQAEVASISFVRPPFSRRVSPSYQLFTFHQQLAHGSEYRLGGPSNRTLSFRIEVPDRFDCVAEELYSMRRRVCG